MALAFESGSLDAIGVEFEATIVDATTYRPLSVASRIAREVQPDLARGVVSPDLFESTLEYTTGICRSIDDARRDLVNLHDRTRPYLDACGGRLLGMGLHPTAVSADFVDVSTPHYEDVITRFRWSVRQVVGNGIHVHVGMPSGDHAIRVAGALRTFMPILLALSASSPFKEGSATGLASTRMAMFSAMPRSGPMPAFENWKEYAAFCEVMAHADAMPAPRETWWDCRPQPTLGTLEIRLMDSIPCLDDVLALSALAWCMTVGIDDLAKYALPPRLSDENRWRAIRHGAAAKFIVSNAGDTEPVGAVVEQLVSVLDGTASDLGCSDELRHGADLGWGKAAHQQLTASAEDMPRTDVVARALAGMTVTW